MSMPSPQPAAPLTPDLAFVVQLQAAGCPGSEDLAGRVEHIASGQASRFVSLTELSAFMGKCALLAELHGFRGKTAGLEN